MLFDQTHPGRKWDRVLGNEAFHCKEIPCKRILTKGTFRILRIASSFAAAKSNFTHSKQHWCCGAVVNGRHFVVLLFLVWSRRKNQCQSHVANWVNARLCAMQQRATAANELPMSCQHRQLLILALNQGLLPSPTRHSSAIFRRTSNEQMNNDSCEQSLPHPPTLLVYKRAKYAALQLLRLSLSLSLSPSLSASVTVGLPPHLKWLQSIDSLIRTDTR